MKWAAANLGAVNPEDSGLYYQWGYTVGHTADYSDYISYTDYINDPLHNLSSLNLTHDAAHVRLGDAWRMPTHDEIVELYNNTDHFWTTINGVNGMKLVCKTDDSKYIFFPEAGHVNPDYGSDDEYCYIWSSTSASEFTAWAFIMGSAYTDENFSYNKFYAHNIRAVIE